MVSRRKILNRSRDDLTIDQEEEDIWHQKDKLYKVNSIWLQLIRHYFEITHMLKLWNNSEFKD